MLEFLRQTAIFLGLSLVCSTLTITVPFLPKIARDKGLSLWIIGVIFSSYPFSKLVANLLITSYIPIIGRKELVILSYFIVGFSMLLMSIIEECGAFLFFIISMYARILGGIGCGILFPTIASVFITEYANNSHVMLGRMEASIGLGILSGPLIGAMFYQISMFFSFMALGVIIMLFVFASWKMLGEFHKYENETLKINYKVLLTKTKIVLPMIVIMACTFSLGFIAVILQYHLSSFGISETEIALIYSIQGGIYFMFTLIAGYIFKSINERIVMIISITIFILSYLMFGPWKLIFPNQLSVVVFSMALMAIAQSLCFSNIYIVFSIPYMIKKAIDTYGFKDQGSLGDAIASYASLAGSVGEMLGPLYGGFVTDLLDIESCCLIIALITAIFCINLIIGTKENSKDYMKLDD